MTQKRFKICSDLRSKLKILKKEAAKKVLAGEGIPDEPPLPPCGGYCENTCSHYCHAQCENWCGSIASKA